MKSELIIVAVLLIVAGCDSSGGVADPQWWGEAQATRNEEIWRSVPIAMEVQYPSRTDAAADSFFFRITTYSEAGWIQEQLSFGQLPKRTGRFELESRIRENRFGPYSTYSLLDGGDAIIATYVPDDSSNNVLFIDRHDPNTDLLEGRFQITLVAEFRSAAGFVDTVRFEDGSFRTIIVEDWPSVEAALNAQNGE